MYSMKMSHLITIVASSAVMFSIQALASTSEELAAQSEAAAVASASVKPTQEMIIEKINKGCKLVEAEGKAAFSKFQGKDSDFIYAGTYIWIHDMEGVMQMHPIKYKIVGKQILSLKDKSGKRFFAVMNEVAQNDGSGWVSYMWPKPGEKKPSKKVSFVKKCIVDGQDMVLGSGVYDIDVPNAR
jgi:signal transduction histidine kinase